MTRYPVERMDAALLRLGAAIVAGAFLSALDATVVFVALDHIARAVTNVTSFDVMGGLTCDGGDRGDMSDPALRWVP